MLLQIISKLKLPIIIALVLCICLFSSCEVLYQSLSTSETTKPSSGNILFKNESSNPYNVYLDNRLVLTNGLPGNSQFLKEDVSVGAHIVHVVQIKGYLFKPTEKSYSITLLKGETLTIKFP